MLQTIFSSRTRVNLLRLFISNPSRRYYLREMSKMLDESITPIRRELQNLKSIGFLAQTKVANIVYYNVDEHFILYDELKAMVDKTASHASSTEGINPELRGLVSAPMDTNMNGLGV